MGREGEGEGRGTLGADRRSQGWAEGSRHSHDRHAPPLIVSCCGRGRLLLRAICTSLEPESESWRANVLRASARSAAQRKRPGTL